MATDNLMRISLSEIQAQVSQAKKNLDATFKSYVQELQKKGCSWETIGNELGISRQAAQQRFGK